MPLRNANDCLGDPITDDGDRLDFGERKALTSNPDNPNDPQKRLAQARQELNQLLDELKPDNPDFVLTQRVDPLNFDQLQDLLDEQTALLQWYIGSENLLCFVITKTHIEPIPFAPADRETLQTFSADYFSDYVQTTWGNTLQSRLEQLATCLDIPRLIAAIPDHCQELILIPHRFLHLFPLHALILPDRFPCGIRYAPSAQLLHRLSQRPAKPQGDRHQFLN